MNGHEHDAQVRDVEWEGLVAGYMRGRGAGTVPDGILADARTRAQARRPAAARGRAHLGFAFTVAFGLVILTAVMATLPGRPTPAMPSPAPLIAPARALVLATYHQTPGMGEVLLRPADPATALPLEGLEPIAIGQPFQTSLSPDGRTLAVMTWLSDAPGSGTLRLIDLDAWAISETPVTGLEVFRGLGWTPDSRSLVWLAPRTVAPTGQAQDGFQVVRWTIGSAAPTTLVALPDLALSPTDARIVATDGSAVATDGSASATTLVVLGRDVDGSGERTGPPRVVTIDLDQPRVTGDIALEGPSPNDPDLHEAVAWDPTRQRLFVASRDDLWTVGLPGLDVTRRSMGQPDGSPGEPDGSPGQPDGSPGGSVGPAVSPDEDPTVAVTEVLSGALSPDGSKLYLTGLRQSIADDADRAVSIEPIGLRVVDTHDGSVVTDPDPTVDQVALSADGSRLLVATADPALGTPSEVRLVEPATSRVLARIPAPVGAAAPYPAEMRISWDGRFGYLGTYIQGDDGGNSQLQIIDLADGSVIAQRTIDREEPIVTLLALGGQGGALP